MAARLVALCLLLLSPAWALTPERCDEGGHPTQHSCLAAAGAESDAAGLVQLQKVRVHEQRDRGRGGDQETPYVFVPPIQRQVVANSQTLPGYVLEFRRGGDVTTFECIAQDGGKISAFKFNGENMILNVATGPSEVWGSTFWTSPQSDWGWPPPEAFETSEYTVKVDEGGMAVTLTGPVDQKLGVWISKRFSVDLNAGAIILNYTIHRSHSGPESFAPWEITRLGPTGMTFYSTGPPPTSDGGFDPLPVQESGGVTWFNHEAPDLSSNKLIANTSCGWYASTKGDLAFVKRFHHIQPQQHAPGEGQIEIYAMSSYVEMENQGAYKKVTKAEPLSWIVQWFLRPLPKGLSVTEGNPDLVEFVENVD